MSCRSTPLNAGITRAAHLEYPSLSDAQIQSLFHDLKREGAGLDVPAAQAYQDFLDAQSSRVRHDPHLEDSDRNRMLARLDEARAQIPDGPTWHAVSQMRATAGTADRMIGTVSARVAEDLGVDPDRMRILVEKWRDAEPQDFEDYPSPDPAYRYDHAPGVPSDKATARALRKAGYEHYLAQRLPVFVYGTLRTGQGNDRLMDGAKASTLPARAEGIAVYQGPGFPYAAEHEDPDAVAVGEVVWLTGDERGDTARMMLDHLEGFDSDQPSWSHYERVDRMVTAQDPDGGTTTVKAWMYLARGSSRRRLSEHLRIPHGDWVADREALFRRHER